MNERTDPPEPAATPAFAAPPRGSAQWIAIGILFSRIAGLVREMVFARYFGASAYADVFRASLRMPNVLQNLLGEGTLSASFIPVYSELIEKGKKDEAGRVAGAVFALLVMIAGALSLFGIIMAPVLVSIFFKGFTGLKRELTITCTRIVFPMTGILVLSAWSLGVLNSHRRFFLPYVAPVLWNVSIIAAMVWFGQSQPDRDLVVTLAWGAFVGGALQFAVQVPAVLRLEPSLKVRLDLKLQGVRDAMRAAGHTITGRGGVQLSGWADGFFASFMSDGAFAMLGYAQTLYMLPVSLFGMSIAAAELPELARNREAAREQLALRLNAGLRQIAVLVVPAVVGYLILGDIIVAALFQRGQFTRETTVLVTFILMAYTIGLLAATATRLYSSAFFALRDTRTPARVAYLRVGAAAVLAAGVTVWVKFVNPGLLRYGPVGLAGASALGAWLEWTLLRKRLAGQIQGVGIGRNFLLRLLAVALAAAGLARLIAFLLPPMHPALTGLIVLAPYGVLYLVTLHLLGIEARIPLLGRLLRRRRPPAA